MPLLPSSLVILAVDIGTGSSRGLLIDIHLKILSTHQLTNNLYEPHSGWVEQDPAEVFITTLQVIRQAAAEAYKSGWKIAGICLSSAVSSLLAVNENGDPLCNAITWADSRSQIQVDELHEKISWLYKRTGVPLHASYWLPKLLWLQRHQAGLVNKTARWMGLKDYIIWRLTGEFVTDVTIAAATGMLNLQTLQWDDLVCSLAGITPNQLPRIQPTTFIIPQIKADIAADLGLTQNIPIILGSGDGMLANLGSGVLEPGQVATTIGSSGACRTMSTQPVLDDLTRVWSYPLIDNLWVIGGANNSGGLIVNWFQKQFMPDSDNNDKSWIQAAEAVPAGSGGLIFLPYLFGERAPIWNANARGVLIGLENRHTFQHVARAVLEGTIFALYDIYQALCLNIPLVKEIRVSGGYTHSPFWLNIQASMFEKELIVLENHECSALGAAILGFYALGLYPDLQSGVALIKVKETILPQPEQSKQYQNLIPLYHLAYHQLKPLFEGLETFRSTLI